MSAVPRVVPQACLPSRPTAPTRPAVTRRWAQPLRLLAAGLAVGAASARPLPPAPVAPVPSAAQLAWQENELTLFVHFGMNTFTGRSTGLGTEDPDLFHPTAPDCRQWARVARETGFAGIILTAKHHDGFCLWPTSTTRHSVAASRWEGGRGDVVRDLAAACREYGLKLGIYCSPWDRSQPSYDRDPPAYSRFYREQLTELLTRYGPIFEMWFDGNKARVDDWPAVIDLVRRLQPDATIKQGPRLTPVREDLRWVGNEVACAPLENWSVNPPPGSPAQDPRRWFPVECDTMMIGHWFWDGTPPRSLAALLDYYYTSVGRNSVLLLNVAPDPQGRFSDASVARLREFHAALRTIFGTDLARDRPATASNVRGGDPAYGPAQAVDGDARTYWATDDGVTRAWLEVDLGGEREFNVVRSEEMIALGQRVERYRIDAWSRGAWRQIAAGTTIGYRKLDRFPAVTASKVRLTIEAARACPAIKAFGVHLDTLSPAASFAPANALREVTPGTRAPGR